LLCEFPANVRYARHALLPSLFMPMRPRQSTRDLFFRPRHSTRWRIPLPPPIPTAWTTRGVCFSRELPFYEQLKGDFPTPPNHRGGSGRLDRSFPLLPFPLTFAEGLVLVWGIGPPFFLPSSIVMTHLHLVVRRQPNFPFFPPSTLLSRCGSER